MSLIWRVQLKILRFSKKFSTQTLEMAPKLLVTRIEDDIAKPALDLLQKQLINKSSLISKPKIS
jgi:hypothetical protein